MPLTLGPTAACRAMALVAAVVLATDLLVVATRLDEPVQRQSPPSAEAASGAPVVRDAVRELQRFVARERGLQFRHDVEVTLLDDGAFRERVLDDWIGVTESDQGVLQALGLLGAGVDLAAEMEAAVGDGVMGFYDPVNGDLVVRGTELTPLVRRVLVHELTHALDDQHFGLARGGYGAANEAGLGFSTLVEGSATAVEQAWLDGLDEQERAAAEPPDDGARHAALSSIVETMLGLPYDVGPRLVEQLRAAGGQRRLDDAFGSPPTTSEHVLHPDRFLAGEAARAVPEPEADGAVVAEGVIGEVGLVLMLTERLGRSAALRAAEGWGGDRYVAWERGGRTCVRARLTADTPADHTELAEALQAWARSAGGDATVAVAPSDVDLLTCA